MIALTAASPASAQPDLAPKLVTIADFPGPGWESFDKGGPIGGRDDRDEPTDPPGCAFSVPANLTDAVGIWAFNTDTTSNVLVSLGYSDGTVLTQTRDWIQRCKTINLVGDKASGTATVHPLVLPAEVVNDGAAYAVSASMTFDSGNPVSLELTTYLVQIGNIGIAVTGMGDTTYPVDRRTLDLMLIRQIAKVTRR